MVSFKIVSNFRPLTPRLNFNNFLKLEKSCLLTRAPIVYWLSLCNPSIKATQMVRNKVLKVATAHRTDLLFAVADDDEFAELMKKFNLHDSGEDVNVGCKAHMVQKCFRIKF